jgi:hypothetical protein
MGSTSFPGFKASSRKGKSGFAAASAAACRTCDMMAKEAMVRMGEKGVEG